MTPAVDSPCSGILGRLVFDLSPLGIPTNERTFAVRYEGSGLPEAGFKHGDTVLIERRKAKAGDIVLALNVDHVVLGKYVIEAGQPLLRSAGSDIPVSGQIRVEGVAVGLIRKL